MQSFNGVRCTQDQYNETEMRVRKKIDSFIQDEIENGKLGELEKAVFAYFQSSNLTGIQQERLNKLNPR